MKILSFIYPVLLILFSGCHKIAENTVALKMSDLTAPSRFNWNSVKTISIHLSNVPADIVRVSSENESELYMKAMGDSVSTEMDLTVIIPSSVTTIKINSYPVTIISGSIDFTFPV